ncbi:helix-turn-helix domain-containing protein [Bacteroidales bacterium AH-315-N07]|nr:helix-turn-helix domain-containing protein [Bacteroidales bacterium AH-315-N07]
MVSGISIKEFGHKSLSRNPLIFGLFERIGLVEKAGTGIQRMKDAMQEQGLSKPDFSFKGMFTVIFKRPVTKSGAISGAINGGLKNKLSDRMLIILTTIADRKDVNLSYLENKLNIPRRNIQRDIKNLKELDIIKFSGSKKTGAYTLTAYGNQVVKGLLH